MKYFVVALAILGVAVAVPKNVNEAEDVAEAMIWCVVDALDGGLPSADVPDHNPLIIERTITIPLNIPNIITGSLVLDKMVLEDIVQMDISELHGTITDTGFVYSYWFYWPSMLFTGNWALNASTPLVDINKNGTTSIDFLDMVFKGVWNMTAAADGVTESLDDFLVVPTVSRAEFQITGLDTDWLNKAVKTIVTPLLSELINFCFPSSLASQALKDLFNDRWMPNATRINAIMNNCKNKTIF